MDEFLTWDDESQRESPPPEVVHRTMDYGLLLEAIQNYPYIYDMTDKLYKDTKKKNMAWEQISEIVNCEVDECMKAWRNLRDRFVKEKNKLASGAGAPATNWPYFQAMLFYQKYSKPRSTYTTTMQGKKTPDSRPASSASRPASSASRPASSASRPASSASVWSNVTIESVTSPEIQESSAAVSEDEAIPGPSGLSKSSETRPAPNMATTPLVKKKRKRTGAAQDPDLEQVMGLAKTIATSIEARPAIPRNINSTFVEYLYQELQALSEEEAKIKRQRILAIMFD